MKKIILLFLIFTGAIIAQDKAKQHPIDKWHDDCIETGTNQSTQGMIGCSEKAYEKWDKELNKVYKVLMAKLKTDDQKVLKEAQKEWIKYRDLEFKLLEKVYSYKEGTMYLPMHAYARLEVVRSRTLRLADFLDLLNKE